MVRFNMRSLAFMAFAVFAAAAPAADSVNRQVAPAAPAAIAAPVANIAPVQVAHPQFGQIERESVQPAHQAQGMMAPVQKGAAQDPSQMVKMVPCSESECFNSLTPEEQVGFRRQCEQMRLEQLKHNANGQNRLAKGAAPPQLTFYKMVPTQAGANGSTAVGNRPNGKNLCCCCCPCCCCCCPCCCCCCKCCCCKCCCCCCPCCCGCC